MSYSMTLPPGWSPRPEQQRIFEEAAAQFDDGKRVVMIEGATGLGKSAIAYSLIKQFGSGVVVTATKQLQDQYRRDFSDMPRLVGRGNFTCNNGSFNCDKGYFMRFGDKNSRSYCPDCPYKTHVDIAFEAGQYVCNYASYVHTAKGDQTMRELVIFDEGHRVEAEIMSSVSIHIDQEWIRRTYGSFPDYTEEEDDLFDWAEAWREDELKDFYSIEHAADRDRLMASIKYMLDTREKLRWVAQANLEGMGKDWVSFKPLRLSRYLSESILARTPRIVILSATILDPAELAKNLCLREEEWAYVASKNSFDPSTRPVVFLDGSLPVTRSEMENAQWAILDAVQTIMEEHDEDKGLIHTSSTRIAQFLAKHLDDPDERILLAHGRYRKKAYEHHVATDEPTILISPSMTEGVDLKGDLARFLIIAKAPFMSLGDLQTAKRAAIDDRWYKMHTIRQIIQAAGRGTRSADDYCVTYVLDDKVRELLEENQDVVPQWFWDAWEVV